jgi:hypothetical protein
MTTLSWARHSLKDRVLAAASCELPLLGLPALMAMVLKVICSERRFHRHTLCSATFQLSSIIIVPGWIFVPLGSFFFDLIYDREIPWELSI